MLRFYISTQNTREYLSITVNMLEVYGRQLENANGLSLTVKKTSKTTESQEKSPG